MTRVLDTRARHEFIRQRQQPWAPLRTRIRLAGLQSYSMNAVSPWRNGKPAPRHNWQSATNLNTPYKSCSLADAKKDIAVETAVYDQKIAELGTVLRALPPTNHNSKSLFFCAEQLRPSRARHQNLCRPRRPFKKSPRRRRTIGDCCSDIAFCFVGVPPKHLHLARPDPISPRHPASNQCIVTCKSSQQHKYSSSSAPHQTSTRKSAPESQSQSK